MTDKKLLQRAYDCLASYDAEEFGQGADLMADIKAAMMQPESEPIDVRGRYFGGTPQWQADPNINRFVRETGHIEYASRLGLGVYDVKAINHTEITL